MLDFLKPKNKRQAGTYVVVSSIVIVLLSTREAYFINVLFVIAPWSIPLYIALTVYMLFNLKSGFMYLYRNCPA